MGKRVAIVGAGLGGLTAAIKLREAGHTVTLFEAGPSVGGVWRDNSYPGAACDVPAILYQLSFAPHPHWSHAYARQPEIKAYTESLVDRFALGDTLRLNEGVTSATWEETAEEWRIVTGTGAEERFDAFVPAVGQLSRPMTAAIPGLDRFAGPAFHSARWDHSVALDGKRIGIIGSAASAAQIIPELAEVAGHLTVFQRSPNWVVPRVDRAVTVEEKLLFATNLPAAMKLGQMQREMIFENADNFTWQAFAWTPEGRAAFERIATNHLEAQVADPALREKLTPYYPLGCKRIIISDDLYPALVRDNVTLETDAIRQVTAGGIETVNTTHDLDVLVLATGFETTDWNWSFPVTGIGGTTLAETWADGAEAYLGILVHGFPNMFVIYGPNTNLGHNSISYMMEAQVGYAVAALDLLEREGRAALDVSAAAQARYNATLQDDLAHTVWADPHCHSWYKNAAGKVTQNWSGDARSYAAAVSEVAAEDLAIA